MRSKGWKRGKKWRGMEKSHTKNIRCEGCVCVCAKEHVHFQQKCNSVTQPKPNPLDTPFTQTETSQLCIPLLRNSSPHPSSSASSTASSRARRSLRCWLRIVSATTPYTQETGCPQVRTQGDVMWVGVKGGRGQGL